MDTGERIGPWEVLRPLGEGGMGEVWLCRHAEDDRRGALKVLKAGMGADDLARFQREMQALAKLRHHAIVSLLDHDLSDPTMPWLVMEHIAGASLETVIDQGPVPLQTCLRPFTALADGLAQAHAYGIHHRDVKSNNVIRKPDGSMVLVDFGAAIEDNSAQVTHAGLMLGTTRYLPPEVVCGDERDNVSADIYALGMLLYEALTGKHAFRGDNGEHLRFHQVMSLKMKQMELDPGPGFPEEVRKVVRLTTHRDPDKRLNRMDDMADLLEVASGWGGRTPMMSLRQSERLTQLKAQPNTPGAVSRSRSGAGGGFVLADEPTARLERPPIGPEQSALVPDERRGFDWLLLGAFVFLFVGLVISISILATGLLLALSQGS